METIAQIQLDKDILALTADKRQFIISEFTALLDAVIEELPADKMIQIDIGSVD